MPKVAAVITAYNREDFVARCVQSILDDAGEGLEVRVLVMDNGSTDGTPRAAALGPSVEVHRTEDNRHIVEVLNRGLAMALADPDTDYVVAMNEDTMYPPGSLRELVAVADAHPESLVTPLQMNYRAPEEIDANMLGHVRQVPGLLAALEGKAELERVYDLPTIIGACVLARRAVWERVGNFDPLFWFYGIDDDLCTRARWLGCRLLLAPQARLYHAHGKLNEDPESPDRPARTRKWRYELQARYLFKLKNPARSLFGAYLDAKMLMFETIFGCLRNLWPAGALHAIAIYLGLALQLPQVAAARRRDFDPANRLKA